MELREALREILRTAPLTNPAWAVVNDALVAMPKKQELALWPADQGKALALMAQLEEVLGGIVYDMAREEVQNQVQSIAKDAKAARARAEQASKGYQATRQTWDRLAERLVAVEQDLNTELLPTIEPSTAERIAQLEKDLALTPRALEEPSTAEKLDSLAMAESGELAGLRERVEKLELQMDYIATGGIAWMRRSADKANDRLSALEGRAAATLTDIGAMSTAEASMQERLDELEKAGQGRGSLYDDINDQRGDTERLSSSVLANSQRLANLEERVAPLDGPGWLRDRLTVVERDFDKLEARLASTAECVLANTALATDGLERVEMFEERIRKLEMKTVVWLERAMKGKEDTTP